MRHRHHSPYGPHSPLTEKQKKTNKHVVQLLLIVLAAAAAALFIFRFVTKSYIRDVEKLARSQYPSAEVVDVDEGAALFPDRVEVIFKDRECGFLFVQVYHRDGLKPLADPETPEGYTRRTEYRRLCDACLADLPRLTDADYFSQYDTDMQGFSIVTAETDPDKLYDMLDMLRTAETERPLRFSIISCDSDLYARFWDGDASKVIGERLYAINSTYPQGIHMLVYELSLHSCSLEYEDSEAPLSFPEKSEPDAPYTHTVTELTGKTGQKVAKLSVWHITE